MAKSKGALILAFGKGKMPMGKKSMDDDMSEVDLPKEGKKAIAQEILDAIKADDADELAKALDDFWA
jgi:hypothetical protein